jgi:hypothetical protein
MPSGRAAAKQCRRSSAGAFGAVLSEIVLIVQKRLVRAVFVGDNPLRSRVEGRLAPCASFAAFAFGKCAFSIRVKKAASLPRLEWQSEN